MNSEQLNGYIAWSVWRARWPHIDYILERTENRWFSPTTRTECRTMVNGNFVEMKISSCRLVGRSVGRSVGQSNRIRVWSCHQFRLRWVKVSWLLHSISFIKTTCIYAADDTPTGSATTAAPAASFKTMSTLNINIKLQVNLFVGRMSLGYGFRILFFGHRSPTHAPVRASSLRIGNMRKTVHNRIH